MAHKPLNMTHFKLLSCEWNKKYRHKLDKLEVDEIEIHLIIQTNYSIIRYRIRGDTRRSMLLLLLLLRLLSCVKMWGERGQAEV